MDSLDNSIWTVEVGFICKHNEKSKYKYGMIQNDTKDSNKSQTSEKSYNGPEKWKNFKSKPQQVEECFVTGCGGEEGNGKVCNFELISFIIIL